MKIYRAAVTRLINARPEHVYRLVAYMQGHQNFLPEEFEAFEIF